MVTILPAKVHGGAVPPELLDLEHPVWRDQPAYLLWCQTYGVDPTDTDNWAIRFRWAAHCWAVAAGITTPTGYVDHPRLATTGVPHCGSLQRARARAGY
jgi:hypothetical protein